MSFWRATAKLAGGHMLAQVIVVAGAPILARLYPPEAFGLLALFLATAELVLVIARLRYDMAIVLPESDRDAVALTWVAALSLTATTLLVALLLPWLGPRLAAEHAGLVVAWGWLLPAFVWVEGLLRIGQNWALRRERFGLQALANVGNAAGTLGSRILLALLPFAPAGPALILGGALGSTLAAVLLWSGLRPDWPLLRGSGLTRSELGRVARRYAKFPLVTTWTNFLNIVSWELPTWLLAVFFETAVVGWYAFATRMIRQPLGVLGRAVAQVYYQAGASRREALPRITTETIVRLAAVAAPAVAFLVYAGPEAFALVFGDRWHEAGRYARILAPYLGVQFVVSAIARVPAILEEQEVGLYFNLVLLALRGAALGVGGLSADPALTLALFAAASASGYLGFATWIVRRLGLRGRDLLGKVLVLVAAGFLMLAPLAWSELRLRPLWGGAWTAVAVGGYYLVLWWRWRGGIQRA